MLQRRSLTQSIEMGPQYKRLPLRLRPIQKPTALRLPTNAHFPSVADAQEAGLPLALRPYEVLVTSNRTALIEMVPDAPSIHGIKSKSPPGTSLAAHFFTKFGRVCVPGFLGLRGFWGFDCTCYETIAPGWPDQGARRAMPQIHGRIVPLDPHCM